MHRADATIDRERAAQLRGRLGAAALVAVLTTSLAADVWTIRELRTHDVADAAIARSQGLTDLMAARSPGARTEGQLIKTKHAEETNNRRVLGEERPESSRHKPVPARTVTRATLDVAQSLEAAPLLLPPAALELPQPLAELGAESLTPSGVLIPGSGSAPPPSGSPSPTFPGPGPQQPVPRPSAVPEPQTWTMMLLGFALVAWRVRRGRHGRAHDGNGAAGEGRTEEASTSAWLSAALFQCCRAGRRMAALLARTLANSELRFHCGHARLFARRAPIA